MLGFMSDKVANKVSEFYVEAAKKRNELVAKRITETLGEEESGLLFIREDHSVQFPGDVEVFSIFPPALDEIHRWYRDQARVGLDELAKKSEEKSEEKGEEKAEDVKKRTAKRARKEPKG